MKKRINLAFIVPDILSEFTKRQLTFLKKYQNEHNISITIFSPFILNAASDETKQTTFPLFKLASDINFDGYILFSNIILGTFGKEFCIKTIEEFSDKFTVSLSFYTDKCCSVSVNNKVGMRFIAQHFINFHHYTKIGFLRGDKNHNEAEERYQAFRECMKEAQLPINKEWIFDGDFQSTTAQYLISDFLKEGGDLPEAIIAVNDNAAIGALNALKESQISQKIAISGFDNIASSGHLGLTTVDQHISEQLDHSISAILDMLSEKEVEPIININPSMVIRSSCGCLRDTNISEIGSDSFIRDDQIGGFNIASISEFSRVISDIKNLPNLKEAIQNLFKALRIESAYIYLFENGDPILSEDENTIDGGGNLFFNYSQKDQEIKKDSEHKDIRNLTMLNHMDEVLLKHGSSMQVISNLQFRNEYYGHLAIIIGDKDPLIIDMIKQEIEKALHHLYIQRTLDKTLIDLQDSVKENRNLLSLLAHDINNPLCNIMNSLEILKGELEIKDDLLQFFKVAEESALSCSNIIDDVLSLQKFKSSKISFQVNKIDMNNFCNNLIRDFKQISLKKKISLNCNNSFENQYFYSNIEMLKSIMRNLISNSIKFSPPGKKIMLEMTTIRKKMIFKISDSGQGFTEEDKKKLFSPFAPLSATPSGSETSTGLGLSLVKALVDQLNGDINLKSKKGQGSCFTVTIPESQ